MSKAIKSALVSTVLMAILIGLLYISDVGSFYKIDWYVMLDKMFLAFIGGITSLIKSLLTSEDGKFVGIKIK